MKRLRIWKKSFQKFRDSLLMNDESYYIKRAKKYNLLKEYFEARNFGFSPEEALSEWDIPLAECKEN